MKKRRTALFAFLLTAAVSLGIGFAALSDSFTIYGDLGANVDNNNLIVCFDGTVTEDSPAISRVDEVRCFFATENKAAAIDGKTACELTFNGLDTKDEVAEAWLVVENRSTMAAGDELDAKLPDELDVKYRDVSQEIFDISATWDLSDGADLTLKPGESIVVNIKVTLKVTPTTYIDASSFEISFTATTI